MYPISLSRLAMTIPKETTAPEPFVDSARAAEFLSLRPRRIFALARAGRLPGHAIGDGKRRIWRFRLSELAAGLGYPAGPYCQTTVLSDGSLPAAAQ
jgi:hypothetical protein